MTNYETIKKASSEKEMAMRLYANKNFDVCFMCAFLDTGECNTLRYGHRAGICIRGVCKWLKQEEKNDEL